MWKRLLISILLCQACANPQVLPDPDPRKIPTATEKDWTILVYMAADQKDLAPYAYMNLYEMESAFAGDARTAASTETTNLVVQLDTPGQTGLRRLRMVADAHPYDNTLSKTYFEGRRESDIASPVVQLLDEPAQQNAAQSARDLQNFLHWGVTTYPARHYMVIVWGHGRGFAPAQSPNAPANSETLRGIAADETQGTYLDTPLLRDTLQAVVHEDLGDRPFDIYASDACLMQSIEVAQELVGVSRFIVGSAQIQPFSGLPYRQLLHEINSGRFGMASGQSARNEDQAYLVARMLPALAAASLHGDGLQARLSAEATKSFTLSALRSIDVNERLAPALHDVGRKLDASLAVAPLRAVQLGTRIQRLPSFLGGATDIGYFLTRMRDTLFVNGWCRLADRDGEEVASCSDAPTTELLLSLGRAQQALAQSVVSAAYGDDYAPADNPSRMAGFAAVSVWLPRNDRDYANRIKDFSTSTFYKSGAWSSFFSRIFSPQAAN